MFTLVFVVVKFVQENLKNDFFVVENFQYRHKNNPTTTKKKLEWNIKDSILEKKYHILIRLKSSFFFVYRENL